MINQIAPVIIPTAGRSGRIRIPPINDDRSLLDGRKIIPSRFSGRCLGWSEFSAILADNPALTPGLFSALAWDNPPDLVSNVNGPATQDTFTGSVINVSAACTLTGSFQQVSFIINTGFATCPSGAINCKVKLTPSGIVGDTYFEVSVCEDTFTTYYLDIGVTAGSPVFLTPGVKEYTFTKPDGITRIACSMSLQAGNGNIGAEVASAAVKFEFGILP